MQVRLIGYTQPAEGEIIGLDDDDSDDGGGATAAE